jgi:putative membrane protein insertion efficiency factor
MYQVLFAYICAGRCRFYPSCSRYAIYAIETHGLIKGIFLAVRRILNCKASLRGMENSVGKTWGYDPVPVKIEGTNELGDTKTKQTERHKD